MSNKPKFNPEKGYQWQPNDKFLITGEDYSIIRAALSSILSTPEAKTIFLAQRASECMQVSLIDSVEKGIAKEIVEKDEKTS